MYFGSVGLDVNVYVCLAGLWFASGDSVCVYMGRERERGCEGLKRERYELFHQGKTQQ